MMKYEKGQSLFEVVLALAVAALIIIAIVVLATISIRNASFSRNQSLTTRYAQEAIEWLRGQRDEGWDAFYDRAFTTSLWCLKSLSWTDAIIGGCGSSGFISDTIFKREISFTILDTSTIDTEVKVYWEDAQGLHETKTLTTFTDWREQ
jgi:Tfp pilus assembly protein PilV